MEDKSTAVGSPWGLVSMAHIKKDSKGNRM